MRLLLMLLLIISGCSTSSTTLYDTMTIEIAQVGNANPDLESFNQFLKRISEYKICQLNKIQLIIQPPVPSFFKNVWKGSDARYFSKKHRTLPRLGVSGKHLNLFVLYLPGEWHKPSIIGSTFGKTEYAVLVDQMSDRSSESSVNLHELGHIINLVDEHKNKQDEVEDYVHCTSKNCVMYWYSGNKLEFDEKCSKNIKNLIKIK